MATGGDRFSDSEYINWLRATLALVYMKEGLEEFTDNQADLFHKQLLKSFEKNKATQACKGLCSSTDIKKDFQKRTWNMSCSFCDAWLQSAISFHRNAPFHNIAPANTHPTQWQTTPWETIKLFVPFGCETDKSAKNADVQGILSLFVNCKHFSTGGFIGRQDLLDKLLCIRNSLLHSAHFKVSETDVKNHFQTVLSFMQGMTGLIGSEKDTLQEAIENVQQLRRKWRSLICDNQQFLEAALCTDLRTPNEVKQKKQDKYTTEVPQHTETLNERGTKRCVRSKTERVNRKKEWKQRGTNRRVRSKTERVNKSHVLEEDYLLPVLEKRKQPAWSSVLKTSCEERVPRRLANRRFRERALGTDLRTPNEVTQKEQVRYTKEVPQHAETLKEEQDLYALFMKPYGVTQEEHDRHTTEVLQGMKTPKEVQDLYTSFMAQEEQDRHTTEYLQCAETPKESYTDAHTGSADGLDVRYKDFRDFEKQVLDKAIVDIVEKMEPKGLLDILVQRRILGEATHVRIRDIKDERNTSDKNRAIRDLVRRSGKYIVFKEGLASTGQWELLHDLEVIEREVHASLKEQHHCDSIESCHLLQQVKHQQLDF